MKIENNIERLKVILNKVLLEEWEAQGHSMTGKVVKEIEYRTTIETDRIILGGYMYPYANIIAAGVKSSKIPFSGSRGRGGTSLYIQALQNYAKSRMRVTGEKESLSVAFAIAHSQKKHGMPTPGGYSFSSTGKRKDWVEEALRKNQDRINEAVSQMTFNAIKIDFDALLAKWQVLLN